MLLDDIATLLDDVAVMTKKAATSSAGVLGDDLALNAEKVSGVRPERELPVVFAVAKGSMLNKLILVPLALVLSVAAPGLITPLLMLGGAFLCFEGVEKLAHAFFHTPKEDEEHHQAHFRAVDDENVDLVAFEKDKIKGAVRTDFILSAEIIVIALGTIADQSLLHKSLVLSAIAILMTIGVYGLVACIVKMDDVGLHLSCAKHAFQRFFGNILLSAAPKLMKFLSIAGTAAMFLVGGAIIVHKTPTLHHVLQTLELAVQSTGGAGKLLAGMAFEGIVGVLTGLVCLLLFLAGKKLFARTQKG
jgi:uncharacterized protein